MDCWKKYVVGQPKSELQHVGPFTLSCEAHKSAHEPPMSGDLLLVDETFRGRGAKAGPVSEFRYDKVCELVGAAAESWVSLFKFEQGGQQATGEVAGPPVVKVVAKRSSRRILIGT